MISEFKIPLHRFDLNLLPADARQIGSEAFKMAVSLHFAAEYAASGQNAIVTVDDVERTIDKSQDQGLINRDIGGRGGTLWDGIV